MHDAPFDDMTRSVSMLTSRREITRLLGAVGALPFLGSIDAQDHDSGVDAARKPNRKNHQQKKRKRQNRKQSICYLDETLRARRKKRKRLLGQGATRGQCPSCGPCPPGTVCDVATCQPCTVTCNSDPATCGAALATALAGGGSVYVCPGTYAGNFSVDSIRLVGAGSGADPASNTILDGEGQDRVLKVNLKAAAHLASLRITGGSTNTDGGGISAGPQADLSVVNCALVGNVAQGPASGGGLYLVGSSMSMRSSLITGNSAVRGGGMQIMFSDNVSISNCVFTANEGESGGGIYAAGSTLAITRTQISDNTSLADGGGGVYSAQEAIVTFDKASQIINNIAAAAGGGILNAFDGTVTLNGAKVSGNTPDQCSGVAGC